MPNDELIASITGDAIRVHVVETAILLGVAIALRIGLLALVRRLAADIPETRRRWSILIRNVVFGMLIVSLVGIWRDEIRALALSIVALAAAFAIATKEGILCVIGGLLKFTSRAFAIGDRIEVGSARGDVIDYNMVTTRLLEVGPQRDMHVYTGRTILVPNSLFLTLPIVNESSSVFVLHVFKIPLAPGEDWRAAERVVLATARSECEPYLDDARRQLCSMIKDAGLESFNVEPRVSLHLGDHDRVQLVVRIPAPNKKKAGMEQAIVRSFLDARARHFEAETTSTVSLIAG